VKQCRTQSKNNYIVPRGTLKRRTGSRTGFRLV